MSSTGKGRRLARIEDADAITETIAMAFHDDPLWSWAFADSTRRPAQFRVWWRVFVDAAFRNDGWTWVTESCESVALWTRPGGTELTSADETELVRLVGEFIGAAAIYATPRRRRLLGLVPAHVDFGQLHRHEVGQTALTMKRAVAHQVLNRDCLPSEILLPTLIPRAHQRKGGDTVSS